MTLPALSRRSLLACLALAWPFGRAGASTVKPRTMADVIAEGDPEATARALAGRGVHVGSVRYYGNTLSYSHESWELIVGPLHPDHAHLFTDANLTPVLVPAPPPAGQ